MAVRVRVVGKEGTAREPARAPARSARAEPARAPVRAPEAPAGEPSALAERPARLPPTLLQAVATTEGGQRVARAIAARFQAALAGAERVPREGGALLVGNHGLLGFDGVPLAALFALATGRVPRFLADRNLWRIPGLPRLLAAAGIVPGSPDGAVRLLRAGELVCVYPGGVDEAFKLSREAHTLRWGDRAGFARVAMRAGVPILPFAGVGPDELFEVRRREHTLGRRWAGSARYDLPLPRRFWPRRVPLEYHVLAPIDTRGDPDDPRDVERVRLATWRAIDEVLRRRRDALAPPAA